MISPKTSHPLLAQMNVLLLTLNVPQHQLAAFPTQSDARGLQIVDRYLHFPKVLIGCATVPLVVLLGARAVEAITNVRYRLEADPHVEIGMGALELWK